MTDLSHTRTLQCHSHTMLHMRNYVWVCSNFFVFCWAAGGSLHTYGLSLSQSLCSCCLITTWKCVPLLNSLLWTGWNGLTPTPDTLHLGCIYHLHHSHRFLSTWSAIMLEHIKWKDIAMNEKPQQCLCVCNILSFLFLITCFSISRMVSRKVHKLLPAVLMKVAHILVVLPR